MPLSTSPVWLITGCSTGFGRELAKLVLDCGWRAVVTARNLASVADLVAEAGNRAMAVALDITDQAQIDAAVDAATEQFGRIDVLVNNAGYGYLASVEEGEDAEIRAQFEANVFGLFALTRRVLPVMRTQRHGHIINITSVAGLIGFPGSGYYAASKHAVEGWSDALLAEVEPLGIHVTCVEPGPFRTQWAGGSLRQTPNNLSEYSDTAGQRLAGIKAYSGTQAGDPVRAAQAMIAITQYPLPPRHLVLGAWGYDQVSNKLRQRLNEIESRRDLSLGADFPEDPVSKS